MRILCGRPCPTPDILPLANLGNAPRTRPSERLLRRYRILSTQDADASEAGCSVTGGISLSFVTMYYEVLTVLLKIAMKSMLFVPTYL